MRLIYKQLLKELIKDKIFLILPVLMSGLTSFSFFFVMFSVDGNRRAMESAGKLSENLLLYQNALSSNTVLAHTFLLSMTGLTSLMFLMFFYRFFRGSKKQIGCIKAFGVRDGKLGCFFAAFAAVLSEVGAAAGLLGGYFASSILINANTETYSVTSLQKGISVLSLITGLIFPAAVFCTASLLCFGFTGRKEAGFLLCGRDMKERFPFLLKAADRVSRAAPGSMRAAFRISLRKPLSLLLLFAAVMSFNVCVILGRSLNLSSAKVLEAQTDGHNYEYDIRFSEYRTEALPDAAMKYITQSGVISINGQGLERTVTGLYGINELYELKNERGEPLAEPSLGSVYINPELSEIYGVKKDDRLEVVIGGAARIFTVEAVAANAQSRCIYINAESLAEITGAEKGAYNGALSAVSLSGGASVSRSERIETLNRSAVSNKVSAVINQSIGVLIGTALIFLALYTSFRDNTHDILILSMLGHPIKNTRRLMIEIYLPITCIAFVITVLPSIALAKSIQASLSVSTDDYMPFGISPITLIAAPAAICLICKALETVFGVWIRRTVEKGKIAEIIADD